ncbi:hypothetical protein C9I98_23755 [Photobacterium sanctipauli]|uniref:ASP external chaperone domain-containing protein n=1 Tax=Photobacterium sanctipauli TaxID=1342794 RepID=A0A2T3NCE1_9GAMM|nr:hypothetical protein [Photobacterium sanctipauli]PSW11659.1 hypothetical protein C9I98_23755 [Photobacterium sanctipauli]
MMLRICISALALSVSLNAIAAIEPLPPLPSDSVIQWQPVGSLVLGGQPYSKLQPVISGKRSKRVAPMVTGGQLFIGDTLLANGSAEGPVEVTGGLFLRLSPEVSSMDLFRELQLELVYERSGTAFVRTTGQQKDLLPMLASLENDSRIQQLQLELVGNINRPQ